jgi:hypothetical protein
LERRNKSLELKSLFSRVVANMIAIKSLHGR